jgi:carboxyl-terminal processing protease
VHREFTEELSRRTFAKIFEIFDPGRLYFTLEDIDQFKPLEDKLNALIAKRNCSFIDSIHSLFMERVREHSTTLPSLLQKKFVQKSPPEKPLTWAKNRLELDERWHQKIASDSQNLLEGGFQGNVSERLTRRYTKQTQLLLTRSRDDVYSDFLNSFALALDPHSAHFLPLEQDEFNSRLGNPVDGVGLTFTDDDDTIAIESIAKNSVADRAGNLKVGDQLLSVDNLDGTPAIDVSKLSILKVTQLLRGKKDSKVSLTFLRPAQQPGSLSQTITVTLRREISRRKSILIRNATVDVRNHKIGIVKLPAFYTDLECRNRSLSNCQGSATDVRAEVERFRDARVEALVLDLRNNSGGDLQESIRTAGLFIPSGPIVQIVDRTGTPRVQNDPDPRLSFAGPIVLLINKNSASAAEIVAAALKDHGRAVVAGDSHSFGKGTIQVIQDLSFLTPKSRDGMLKITQATFYSPNGSRIQKTGVTPNIVIPSPTKLETDTEASKDFVIETTPVKPAAHFKPPPAEFDLFLETLRQRSAERILKNPEFKEMTKILGEKRNASTSLKDPTGDDLFPAPTDAPLQEAIAILTDMLEKTVP